MAADLWTSDWHLIQPVRCFSVHRVASELMLAPACVVFVHIRGTFCLFPVKAETWRLLLTEEMFSDTILTWHRALLLVRSNYRDSHHWCQHTHTHTYTHTHTHTHTLISLIFLSSSLLFCHYVAALCFMHTLHISLRRKGQILHRSSSLLRFSATQNESRTWIRAAIAQRIMILELRAFTAVFRHNLRWIKPRRWTFVPVLSPTLRLWSEVRFPSSSSQQNRTEQNLEVHSGSLLQSGWSTGVKRIHLFNLTSYKVSELCCCRWTELMYLLFSSKLCCISVYLQVSQSPLLIEKAAHLLQGKGGNVPACFFKTV